MNRWDARGIELARLVGGWSKDPSTQVGAAILRPDKTVASVGFNGLPRGVGDLPARLIERETKHSMIRHAEENALAFAREPLTGYTLYVAPLWPCSRCAGAIIQAGITRVVYALDTLRVDWAGNAEVALSMLREAGVGVEEFVESGERKRAWSELTREGEA